MALRRLTMHVPGWWDDMSEDLRKGCDDFYKCYWYYLCAVYAVVGIAALVQLIRIQKRVPGYGWTIQKVFHLLNVVICFLRALTFGLYSQFDEMEDALGVYTVQLFIFDIASLLFFTTYSLLVLLWAEIYHIDGEAHKLRHYFLIMNAVVYFVQTILWFLTIPDDTEDVARSISAGWLTFVFLVAVAGFVLYGGRLFYIISKFPIDSNSRRRRLREVGINALVCSICFLIRAAVMFMYILDEDDFDLDLMDDDFLNIVFYLVCEIVPVVSVLIIVRRLPPKPTKSQHGGREAVASDAQTPLVDPEMQHTAPL